ncbi:retropepsin-like aspartic protease [Chitinophaga sp. S165]|uniref:retropepsin-like aspartic protease n=1 Tax=Chitinophaga sp. S165 TaxID=2135462 RepID=UPI000D719FEC|nr:retropepsin-like aspartic protease [Chitinophaga sp. S165]PWV51894.1 aspartyl protease [Chitinophaga sp. S165]
MKKLLTLFFLCLSFNLFARQTIPFTLAGSGHIIIKATVEGVEGNFIFDTGAGLNLLFDKFAKKLPPRQSYNFFTGHRATGEPLNIPIYHSDKLKIGNAEFKNQVYTTFALDIPGIDGLISLQAFQHTALTIDYDKKEISIGQLSAADKKKYIDIAVADYAGRSLDIFTDVKVNDSITVQVMLDAGAGQKSFWLSDRFMNTLGLEKTAFKVIDKKSEFDSTKVTKIYNGTIVRIATENGLSKVEHPPVFFVEGLIYEGKTSIEWLGRKIAISIPDKKIYIIR